MEEKIRPDDLKVVVEEIAGWENNKILRTLSFLTTRPSQLLNEYCEEGNREYLSPVVYYFGVASLSSFLDSTLGDKANGIKKFTDAIRDYLPSKSYDTSYVSETMNSSLSFYYSEAGQKIVIIPIMLLLTWLIYKKYNPKFKENCWFALFTFGHITLFQIPLNLFRYFSGNLYLSSILSILLGLAYWTWVSKQFYKLTVGRAMLLRFYMLLATVFLVFLGAFFLVTLILWTGMK